VRRFQVGLQETNLAIEVALQDERCEVRAIVHDPQNLMPKLLERSLADDPFLTQIDWYGDTVFNRIQMSRFLLAWKVLAERTQNNEEAKLVDEIRQLAEQCESGVHLYLKFIGD
jgi:hypothetical protein